MPQAARINPETGAKEYYDPNTGAAQTGPTDIAKPIANANGEGSTYDASKGMTAQAWSALPQSQGGGKLKAISAKQDADYAAAGGADQWAKTFQGAAYGASPEAAKAAANSKSQGVSGIVNAGTNDPKPPVVADGAGFTANNPNVANTGGTPYAGGTTKSATGKDIPNYQSGAYLNTEAGRNDVFGPIGSERRKLFDAAFATAGTGDNAGTFIDTDTDEGRAAMYGELGSARRIAFDKAFAFVNGGGGGTPPPAGGGTPPPGGNTTTTTTTNGGIVQPPGSPTDFAPKPLTAADGIQPVMGRVTPDQTVQGQLNDILKNGNPILEAARTRAIQAANARGLQNSSMASQAGEEAIVNSALQIATPDAAAYQKQALANQDIANQFLSQKEGANIDLNKAYEAFKQNNYMFDKDEALKKYINDSSISSQEKMAALANAAHLEGVRMQVDGQLKAAGLSDSQALALQERGFTQQDKANMLNISQTNFNNYTQASTNIDLSDKEPDAKAAAHKNLDAIYAGKPGMEFLLVNHLS